MRFIIVLGVLLCLVQLVAGIVYCIDAKYKDGKWTPLDKAKLVKGPSCQYGVWGECQIDLSTTRSEKMGYESFTAPRYICKTDKCNTDVKNMTWLLQGSNFCGNVTTVLNNMPPYYTLNPQKLVKCTELKNIPIKDDYTMFIRQQQLFCAIVFGDDCSIGLIAVPQGEEIEHGCVSNSKSMYCTCNDGDECHMDVRKWANELKTFGMHQDVFAKCGADWNTMNPQNAIAQFTPPQNETAISCAIGDLFLNIEWRDYDELEKRHFVSHCVVIFKAVRGLVETPYDDTFCLVELEAFTSKFKDTDEGCFMSEYETVECGCKTDNCHADILRWMKDVEEVIKTEQYKTHELVGTCINKWKSVPSNFLQKAKNDRRPAYTKFTSTEEESATKGNVALANPTDNTSTDWNQIGFLVIFASTTLFYSL